MGGGGIHLSAKVLYADLISIEVFKYLQSNGVDFYFIDVVMSQEILKDRGIPLEEIHGLSTILSEYQDYLKLKDTMQDKIKVIGNQRVTTNQPTRYQNQIYFYGPCTAYGAFVNDDETIESYLQKLLNENQFEYRVVNCGSVGSANWVNNDLNAINRIMNTKYHSGDIVILIGHTLFKNFFKLPNRNQLSFEKIFTTESVKDVKCFQDDAMIHFDHINEEGNYCVANAIYDRINSTLNTNKTVDAFLNRIKREIKIDDELAKYLEELSDERVEFENIGAVVMNCNPFTKGHLHLIEKALSQVEFLYVFVVEEDLSEFSFKDRFAIVKENCKKFSNVKVIPSGKYMISSYTFAEYFNKDKLQDESIMPAKDVRLFGRMIAPTLNIKTRFVGEEPLDNVTRQYNETLKNILIEYGIELKEIPRMKLKSGEVINATEVRRLIKDRKFSECRQYLTEETYKYIIDANLFKR